MSHSRRLASYGTICAHSPSIWNPRSRHIAFVSRAAAGGVTDDVLHKAYGLAARVLPRRQPTDDFCLRQRYVLLRNRGRGWGCKYAGQEGESACVQGLGEGRGTLRRRRVLFAHVCPTGVSETDKYISEHVKVVMPVQLQRGVRYAAPDEQRADVRFPQLRITVRLTMHITSTYHTYSTFFHPHVSWTRTNALLAA